MSVRLVFRPEARADVIDARAWYERQQPGLGNRFITALDELLARISQTPEIYAVVLKTVRRAKLRRFPYLVYYRVLKDTAEVLAVLDARRDPHAWRERI
jgi:plasmid stabilization system protein ParE